jgi:hypothetical protein
MKTTAKTTVTGTILAIDLASTRASVSSMRQPQTPDPAREFGAASRGTPVNRGSPVQQTL